MAWIFPDEATEAIEAVFYQVERQGAWVPALWVFEVANVLQMAVRSRRYSPLFRDQAFASLEVLPIETEDLRTDRVWRAISELAARHRLTVYDAAYLELAKRRNIPLATLDIDLRTAATHEHIPLLGL
jgi:predicted nucleic acid-binding protein